MNKANQKARVMMLLAVLLSAAALALYLMGGTNKLCPELSLRCIGCLGAACLLGLILLVVGSVRRKMPTILTYVLYLLALAGFMEYIVSQLNYIANVFYGVDGNHFTPIMITTAGTALLAWVLSLSAGITLRKADLQEVK